MVVADQDTNTNEDAAAMRHTAQPAEAGTAALLSRDDVVQTGHRQTRVALQLNS